MIDNFPYIDQAVAKHLLSRSTQPAEALTCFLAYLSLATRKGHLCVTVENGALIPDPQDLGLDNENIDFDEIHKILLQGSTQVTSTLNVISEKDRYYFPKYWNYEMQFKRLLQAITDATPALECNSTAANDAIDQLISNRKLLPEQANAIYHATQKSLSIISGGPGTGKTYTAAYIIQILSQHLKQTPQIALAAPTGKAAANLQASMGKLLNLPIQAKTLHALLGIKHARSIPTHLTADIILVDESSMIDAKMMLHLFASIKPGSRLILLGDRHQLPPVESGGLFSDIACLMEKTGKIAYLTQCLRTELHEILAFANAVNHGDYPHASTLLTNSACLALYPTTPNIRNDLKSILDYAASRFQLPESMSDQELLDSFNRFRILSPLRKGILGVDNINLQIASRIPKQGRIAAPIMILSNDTRLGLFNGEVGLLIKYGDGEIKKGDYAIFPSHDGQRLRKYPAILLPKHDYAYCLSIHKSQGSEFDEILILLPQGSESFGRELLYTAVTRARKQIKIYSNNATLQQIIQRRTIRLSGIN